jgi:hypothetical protein
LHRINVLNYLVCCIPYPQEFHMKLLKCQLINSFNVLLSLLTSTLNPHLNLRQNLEILNQSTFFCSSKHQDIHTYYIDNQQTANHRILIFGLRELTSTEMNNYCLNNSSKENLSIRNDQSHFTSNYKLRIYTSGCYYLDENNSWQSDRLKVN